MNAVQAARVTHSLVVTTFSQYNILTKRICIKLLKAKYFKIFLVSRKISFARDVAKALCKNKYR